MKLVLLLCVFTCCILTSTWCLPTSRIIGGESVARGDYPWVTLVEAFNGGQVISYCGGSLISSSFVLTAAQCIEGADKARIWLGAYNISNPLEFSRVRLNATSFYTHPDYNNAFYDNDIALIRLPRTVSSSPYISPATLPTQEIADLDLEGIYGTMLGWGFISQNYNKMHDVLMKSPNRVIAPSTCETRYGAGWMSPNKYCVETAGGRGPCFGDSGGALMAHNEDGSPVVFAIFSFLDTDSCIQGIPVGYTKVGAYLDWIKGIAGV
ncbi:Hypothetical predicted protein [Cloeon dipterum]|uniref:Peptidase S1 domain-containing protein n=1 Tax=Cloeon dipterum TaxID=197152 RepID=A0A8S1D913_9INSE|nr:Hypothetical predicted protein [Cloeon dipterum]